MVRVLVMLSGWVWIGLLAPAVFAGGGEAGDELEMEMFFAPAETVTSAARHVQPLSESPSAVTVLTREDIEASGARTLPEVLRLVPNMDVHLLTPIWYGVGVRGGTTVTSDLMLLLVDGRDVTAEIFGTPFWNAMPFSVDDIERIEVIRGPGSALYGANAYAGVVHVITRKPGTGPTLAASVRGGEHGMAELACRGSRQMGPVALGASLAVVRDDMFSSRDVTGRELLSGRLDGVADLGADSRLRVDLSAMAGRGEMYSALGEMEVDGLANLAGRVRLEHEELLVQASYDRTEIDSDIDLLIYFEQADLEIARIPPVDGLVDKVSVQAQHGAEVASNRLIYGAEYVYNHYWGNILIPRSHDEHRLGVYLQDEIQLHELIASWWESRPPPLILTLGLRYDHNSLTESELSPRAAVVFVPAPDHSIRVGYAHAFLKPTFLQSSLRIRLEDVNELGFDEVAFATDLDNQTIDSLELGYQGAFLDGRLILRLDLSYNWYRDALFYRHDPSLMEYKQIGPLRVPDITGPGIGFINKPAGNDGHTVELEAIARPTDHSRLYLQAGYRQMFDNRTGAYIRTEPVWRLGTGGDLRGESGWMIALRAYYTAAHVRPVLNPLGILEPDIMDELEESWLFNARLAWRFDLAPHTITVGIEGFNLARSRTRQLGGLDRPNQPDHNAERPDRRVVLFLEAAL